MFERFKRLLRSIVPSNEDEPESFDHPRPQRVNPNPPQRDWFARVRDASLEAEALSPEAERQASELFAKMNRS